MKFSIPSDVMIYLDMDGVLADFFAEVSRMKGVNNYREIPPERVKSLIQTIQSTDFFYRLPKFEIADAIINLITDINGKYGIISSPLTGDKENSELQKRKWINKNLHPQPEEIFITEEKQTYALGKNKQKNILIDDRGANITKWEEAGGIGIKFQSDEDDIQKIFEGLTRAEQIYHNEIEFIPQNLSSREM
jgi:hypothetical protein